MDHEVPGSWMVTESEVEVTLDSLCELPKLSGKTEGTASLQQPLVDKASTLPECEDDSESAVDGNVELSDSESEQSQGDTLCADCGEFEKFTVSDTPDGESLIKFGCGCGVGTMRATPEGALTRYRLTSWSPTERDVEAHDDESVDEAEAETATEMEQMEPSEATVSEMLQSTSDICDYCGWTFELATGKLGEDAGAIFCNCGSGIVQLTESGQVLVDTLTEWALWEA